ADEAAPARVRTVDARGVEPDLLHLLGFEALEGAIEGEIGTTHSLRFSRSRGAHFGGGAMKTRRASRSGPGLVTACSEPAGQKTTPPASSVRNSASTRKSPIPSST